MRTGLVALLLMGCAKVGPSPDYMDELRMITSHVVAPASYQGSKSSALFVDEAFGNGNAELTEAEVGHCLDHLGEDGMIYAFVSKLHYLNGDVATNNPLDYSVKGFFDTAKEGKQVLVDPENDMFAYIRIVDQGGCDLVVDRYQAGTIIPQRIVSYDLYRANKPDRTTVYNTLADLAGNKDGNTDTSELTALDALASSGSVWLNANGCVDLTQTTSGVEVALAQIEYGGFATLYEYGCDVSLDSMPRLEAAVSLKIDVYAGQIDSARDNVNNRPLSFEFMRK